MHPKEGVVQDPMGKDFLAQFDFSHRTRQLPTTNEVIEEITLFIHVRSFSNVKYDRSDVLSGTARRMAMLT
jgi:hypothetical protein